MTAHDDLKEILCSLVRQGQQTLVRKDIELSLRQLGLYSLQLSHHAQSRNGSQQYLKYCKACATEGPLLEALDSKGVFRIRQAQSLLDSCRKVPSLHDLVRETLQDLPADQMLSRRDLQDKIRGFIRSERYQQLYVPIQVVEDTQAVAGRERVIALSSILPDRHALWEADRSKQPLCAQCRKEGALLINKGHDRYFRQLHFHVPHQADAIQSALATLVERHGRQVLLTHFSRFEDLLQEQLGEGRFMKEGFVLGRAWKELFMILMDSMPHDIEERLVDRLFHYFAIDRHYARELVSSLVQVLGARDALPGSEM